MTMSTRRSVLMQSGALAMGAAGVAVLASRAPSAKADAESKADKADPLFKISLAEWSLHKALFAKEVDHLDFAKMAKTEFGIDAVEYVNQFFKDKAKDQSYLADMKKRCDDLGVRSVLIM